MSEPQLMDPIMVKNWWWFGEEGPSSERSCPHPHQIHLSDTLILETTGSHITIQYEAFNNYFSRYKSWPIMVSEKNTKFPCFLNKNCDPLLSKKSWINIWLQYLIMRVKTVAYKFTVYHYHWHVHHYYTHQNMLDLPWEDNSLAPKWNNKQKINVVSLNQFTSDIYLKSDLFISN